MSDLQARYWLEARECLSQVGRQDVDDPEFWANLLGAVANATMASTPPEVVQAAEDILSPPQLQKRARSRVKKDLQK